MLVYFYLSTLSDLLLLNVFNECTVGWMITGLFAAITIFIQHCANEMKQMWKFVLPIQTFAMAVNVKNLLVWQV